MMATLIEDHLLYNNEHAYLFLYNTFDMDLDRPPVEVRNRLDASDAVANMGIWPAEDSVQVIDGVLVIKLADIDG